MGLERVIKSVALLRNVEESKNYERTDVAATHNKANMYTVDVTEKSGWWLNKWHENSSSFFDYI